MTKTKLLAATGVTVHDEQLTDIHINVSPDPNDPCKGVVVEMIPHRRPDGWSHKGVIAALTGATGKPPVAQFHRYVRVTGPLFLDSRHEVNGCPNPKRMSLWEIHPVYHLDVCHSDDPSSCRIDRDEDWSPLPE